jgi:Cu(I)/Ag(I) efflux system membrane fusion protein
MKILILILILFGASSCKEKTKENARNNESQTMNKKDQMQDMDELHLSDLQIQLGNIIVDSAQIRTLGEEILLNANVSLNKNLTKAISSRIMGRIDKLYFKNNGDVVSKGQALYQLYSEELGIAIRELLLSNEKKETIKNQDIDIDRIIMSTKKKLELFGLTEKQILKIEKDKNPINTIDISSPVSGVITSVDAKEGNYVMVGTDIFHLSEFSSVWVEAQVYSEDLINITEGSITAISFPSISGKTYSGNISFVRPELNSSSKIAIIRVQLENPNGELIPGIQAYVSVLTNKTKALSLPTDAIIIDAKGSTVWIKTGYNTFKSKMVETGIEANGYTEIKSGISNKDTIVISGAYLLHSEYQSTKGMSPMEGHDMSKM